MVTTRAQARALLGNGRDVVSQPRYYESDDDSSDGANLAEEALPEDEVDSDEDEMMTVQVPSLIQNPEQNFTLSRRRLRVVNGNYSSVSYQTTTVLQPTELTDDVQTTAHRDASHERTAPQERSSEQLEFFEQQHETGPPSYEDLLQLEFFQTFPHDPAATLCKRHFLQLAGSWFMRRQGHTEKTIYDLSQKFPYSAPENLFEHTRDLGILTQVVWDEPWKQMSCGEFEEILRGQLHCVEAGLLQQRHRAIVETGNRPRCGFEDCGVLSCGYCLALKNDGGDLYELVRQARAEDQHGEWRSDDDAAIDEFCRRMNESEIGYVRDMIRYIRPAYVSVGAASETKSRNEYTVGWVCALPKEQTAATAMLDKRHVNLPKPQNDSNTYTLGSIGKHNVVITCLPKGQIGNNQAATVAAQMVSTFPSIRFGLMVGIGGGIPPKVRLGDVVVSTPLGSYPGVVQWDFGKAKDDGFERTGSLNNPPSSLLTAITALETEHELVGSKIPEYLDELKQKWPRLAPRYLKCDSLEDVLFKADYSHACQSTADHDITSNGDDESEEEEESCRFCDKTKVVKRKPREMRVHYGLIASGNQVIKSATHRDELNKDLGGHLLCVEMEAAGLMNNFPCVVIRGICDYADSHKNKDWQEYAAAVAAAFAKELLEHVQPSDVDGERTAKDMLGDVLANISTASTVVSQMKSHLDNDKDSEILKWITPFDYGLQHSDFLKKWQPGTGKWLLDSTEYQTWMRTRKQTLFCPGIPGAGKTILTSIAVDHLEKTFKTDPSIGIAYIYCNYRRHEEQVIEKLLASLLKQLSQGQHSLPGCVRGMYNQHKGKWTRPSLSEILAALHSVAEMYSRVFIIVDALDECQDSDGCRQTFITELFKLQEKCEANLFMTSRFIPEIVGRFKAASASLEIRASTEDIERYLKSNISQLPTFIQKNPELQQKIATGISEVVDGMFLLAQIYLNSLSDKVTPKAINIALKGFQKPTPGSNEAQRASVLGLAYEQAMLRINGQQSGFKDLAHQVLLWIHALAVEVDALELDEDNIPSIQDMVSSNVIRLVHYTTQDAEIIMADICTAYLMFDTFERGPCQTKHDFQERLELNPLYDYAAHNWGHHARKASKAPPKAMQFLESKLKMRASVEVLNYHDWVTKEEVQHLADQTTSLHLAGYFGIEEIVEALLKTIDVTATDYDGATPLSWAAYQGQEAIVKLLLAIPGVVPDTKNNFGYTPLSLAAYRGHEAVVKLLLAIPSVDANSRDNDGCTPLIHAAGNGQEAVVRLLLAAGAEVDTRDKSDQTPLMVAQNIGSSNFIMVYIHGSQEPTYAVGISAHICHVTYQLLLL
ncbi:hypothetical protein V8C42DRAFT_357458 [Trichoderma barbatum]